MDYNHICISCMKEKNSAEEICPHCHYNPADYRLPSYALPPYTVLRGRYLIGKVLGAGGFGITYIAMDLILEHAVAIKEFFIRSVMNRDNSQSSEVSMTSGDESTEKIFRYNRQKFEQEAKILASLSDLAGIVRVYDYFSEFQTSYIVMEYLPGKTLKDYVEEKGGKLSVVETLEIVAPVMTALEYVHRRGLLHRDISPDNMKFVEDEYSGNRLKLYDFGGARKELRDPGNPKSEMILKKGGYTPIEQIAGSDNQGPWTDVYAMGATIYFCICGRKPVGADERAAGAARLQIPSQMGVNISPQKEAVLLKALENQPERRYQTMKEFQEALYAPDGQGGYDGDMTVSGTTANGMSGFSTGAGTGAYGYRDVSESGRSEYGYAGLSESGRPGYGYRNVSESGRPESGYRRTSESTRPEYGYRGASESGRPEYGYRGASESGRSEYGYRGTSESNKPGYGSPGNSEGRDDRGNGGRKKNLLPLLLLIPIIFLAGGITFFILSDRNGGNSSRTGNSSQASGNSGSSSDGSGSAKLDVVEDGDAVDNAIVVQTETPQTNPPQTDPPQTDPPQTDPPQTDPPQTDPPQTDPPQTNPPQTEAPVYDTTEGGIHRYDYVITDCTWMDAVERARSAGGYLVHINSSAEYSYILSEIQRTVPEYTNKHFYIGGRRDNSSRNYYWMDNNYQLYGEVVNSPYYWAAGEWLSGEPSFHDDIAQVDECYLDFFYYKDAGGWVWNDIPNDITAYYGGKIGYIVEYEY